MYASQTNISFDNLGPKVNSFWGKKFLKVINGSGAPCAKAEIENGQKESQ